MHRQSLQSVDWWKCRRKAKSERKRKNLLGSIVARRHPEHITIKRHILGCSKFSNEPTCGSSVGGYGRAQNHHNKQHPHHRFPHLCFSLALALPNNPSVQLLKRHEQVEYPPKYIGMESVEVAILSVDANTRRRDDVIGGRKTGSSDGRGKEKKLEEEEFPMVNCQRSFVIFSIFNREMQVNDDLVSWSRSFVSSFFFGFSSCFFATNRNRINRPTSHRANQLDRFSEIVPFIPFSC